MPDPRPDEIREQSFGTSLRGFRPEAVREYLDQLAEQIRELISERDRLKELADQTGKMDLKSEFDRIGAEVGEVLHAARTAADGMRTRAADDAAMLSAKTKAESEVTLREASQQAEVLRGDAWEAAEALLSQAMSERDRVREETERERLALIGRAERDAHRLVANARQEADETVRQAKMESERLVVEARSQHDDIIDQARSQAETAQERAAALERRRTELLGELEAVRATVSRLESDIQEKREELEAVEAEKEIDIGPPAPAPDPETGWGAIRVIPPSEIEEPREIDATDVAEEVRTLRDRETVVETQGRDVAEDVAEAELESKPNELDSLFASLRGNAETDKRASEPETPTTASKRDDRSTPTRQSQAKKPPNNNTTSEPQARPRRTADDVDVDALLLPITNRVLRDIKRQLTEAQNVALDGLRVEEGEWEPDRADLVDRLGGYLTVVSQESYGAGFAASEAYTGTSPGRPKPTADELGDPVTEFTDALADTLTDAVDTARQGGQGPRQLSATVSRIYRGWRTDEAERRVREVATAAFRAGLGKALSSTDVDAEEILQRIHV